MACNRLPNTVTKQELKDAHRVKIAAKKIVRENTHKEFAADFERYKEWQRSMLERAKEEFGSKRQHVL